MADTWTEYGIQQMLRISLDTTTRAAQTATTASFHLIGTNNTNLTKDAGDVAWTGSALQLQELSGSGYASQTLNLTDDASNLQIVDDSGVDNQQNVQIANVQFSASGGSLTAYGAAMVVDNRVWAVFDFGGAVTVTDGGTLTLTGCELQITV